MRLNHLIGLFSVGGLLAVAAVACGDDVSSDPGATTNVGPGSGGGPAGPGPASSSTGTGGSTDESTSCADAVNLTEAMNAAGGVFYEYDGAVINPPGDEDYFKITVEAGQYWLIGTEANPMDEMGRVDTVVTLLSEDGNTQLAEVDDSFPRVSTDTEMFHRFVAAGTYCLKVQEFSTWNGDAPLGDPSFVYRIFGVPIDFALYPEYTADTEPNNNLTEAQLPSYGMLTNMQNFTVLTGMLDTDTDVDWYEIVPPTDATALSLDLTPWGDGVGDEQGFGNTNPQGVIELIDNMANVVGRVDAEKVRDGLEGLSSVPVFEGQTYFVKVPRAGGTTVGTNDFYILKFSTQNAESQNPQETEPNNDATTANVSVGQPNGTTTSHFIGGTFAGGNDIDYWTFDMAPQPGNTLVVVCSSWAAGSGVRDMHVAYLEGTTVVRDAAEDEAKGVLWTNAPTDEATDVAITVGAAGPYYIRLSATMLAGGSNNWSTHYLCGLHISQ
jgi:hypothetical protein